MKCIPQKRNNTTTATKHTLPIKYPMSFSLIYQIIQWLSKFLLNMGKKILNPNNLLLDPMHLFWSSHIIIPFLFTLSSYLFPSTLKMAKYKISRYILILHNILTQLRTNYAHDKVNGLLGIQNNLQRFCPWSAHTSGGSRWSRRPIDNRNQSANMLYHMPIWRGRVPWGKQYKDRGKPGLEESFYSAGKGEVNKSF